jgi:broad specificity phosphatase PhoE
MNIIFVRHGQTDANANMQGGKAIQELDEPLNALGQQQAESLAHELKSAKFDAIVSSPLRRALQTAEIINKYHAKPIEIANDLRERDAGAYIDTSVWNELFDFEKNIPLKNGESLDDFFDRVENRLGSLAQRYPDKTLVVVSHGGVHHVVYAYANKLPRSGNMRISPLHNCEYREYEIAVPSKVSRRG